MSTERIKQLHEQASERYLNGDYQGAVQAWNEVVEIDPTEEQAIAGIRMASQFVEPAPPAPVPVLASAEADVESELDRGLKILDGAVDHEAAPGPEIFQGMDDILGEFETPADSMSESEESFGLEPVALTTPSASAAAAELTRRVAHLLSEAKAKAAAGEREEALAILSRLAILDEENEEADALRARIETSNVSDADKIERWIIEGVAAFEAGQLDEAESLFREVIGHAPGHREAQDYLEKIEERRSAGPGHDHEELLPNAGGESAPTDDAVPLAMARQKPPTQDKAQARLMPSAASEPHEPLPALHRPRFAMPPPRILAIAGGGLLVVVVAAFAVPHLFHRAAPAEPPVARTPGSMVWKAPKAKPGSETGKTASAAPSTPEDLNKAVSAAMDNGRSRMASGDFGGAVLSFNEVLKLDPGNAEAKAGIVEAGERYKASKAERDALNNIKLAFRDGEFSSALRIAYRLPPEVDKSYADGIKAAGWYNMAIVALRAGDCREAQTNLDEALQIAPADADAKKLREFASRYADAVKDRSFLDRVEALQFRALPSS